MEKRRFRTNAVSPGLDKLLRHRILTAEEELELARRARRGDARAVDLLIKHNLRSVMKTAQGFRGYGLDLEDLFQVGVIGLHRAVMKFDPTRGFRLGTYAAWWIRQAIGRYCRENSRLIRLPNNVWNRLYRLKKKQRAADADPGNKELAAELAADPDLAWLLQVMSHEPVSLDELAAADNGSGGGDHVNLYDVVADGSTSSVPAEKRVDDEERAALVRRALTKLSPREQHILSRRYADEDTLAEIAADHELSRERVRQIEEKALRKLGELILKLNGQIPD